MYRLLGHICRKISKDFIRRVYNIVPLGATCMNSSESSVMENSDFDGGVAENPGRPQSIRLTVLGKASGLGQSGGPHLQIQKRPIPDHTCAFLHARSVVGPVWAAVMGISGSGGRGRPRSWRLWGSCQLWRLFVPLPFLWILFASFVWGSSD